MHDASQEHFYEMHILGLQRPLHLLQIIFINPGNSIHFCKGWGIVLLECEIDILTTKI